MIKAHAGRIFAVSARASKLGYVVFERSQLLDYGVRRFRAGHMPTSRIGDLLKLFRPFIVVLHKGMKKDQHHNVRLRKMTYKICAEAKKYLIPITFVTQKLLDEVFSNRTKHEIATLVARQFPELAAKVPPKRKPWQPEHWRSPMFDAIALGICYMEPQIETDTI